MTAFLERLYAVLESLPSTDRYWVAYSGGRDSQVLLHAMAALSARFSARLHAVHVDHGLQPQASDWRGHCARYCAEQEIPLTQIELALRQRRGDSLEAVAREARYRVFSELLQPGDTLLTAHHQDDQAETVLLQLLRGSGPKGLAGMPSITALGRGWLARPLLGFPRRRLSDYACDSGLSWIEDASNADTDFDRNFLRHQVIPMLARRWPALGSTLSRTARHCAEAQKLIEELAGHDLSRIAAQGDRLSVAALRGLPGPRRRVVLRYWLQSLGLALPDSVHLDRISDEVLAAAADRTPLVAWSGAEVRRYRDHLYAMRPLPRVDPSQQWTWDLESPLLLSPGLGRLQQHAVRGTGLDVELWRAAQVTVALRQGGERCQPLGRGHRHRLKKLFQERGVPPWQRDRTPLVYLDGQLAAVVGCWICEPFQAPEGAPGVEVVWLGGAGIIPPAAESCRHGG